MRTALVLLLFSGAVGLAAHDLSTPVVAAAWASLAIGVSQVTHEAAHLAALRILSAEPYAGAVIASAWQVWIAAPALIGWRHRLVAGLGPAAGISSLVVLGHCGVPQLIWGWIALIHLVNLLPCFPDGRALLGRVR